MKASLPGFTLMCAGCVSGFLHQTTQHHFSHLLKVNKQDQRENIMAMDHRLSLLASFLLAISLATTTTLTSSSERGNNATTTNISLVTAITETKAPNQTYPTAMSTSSNVTVDGALSTTSYRNSSQNSTGTTTHNAVQDISTTTTALPESSNTTTTTESTPSALAPTDKATSAATTDPGIVPSTAPTSQAAKTTENQNSTSNTPPQQSTTNLPQTTNTTTLMATATHNVTQGFGLDNSEKGMTIFFSVVLGVFVLGIFMYMLNRWNQMRQYSHRPLYNNSEAEVGGSLAADDTLVISGGLYDGSQIYNPTMTTTDMTEDEFNFDNHLRVAQPSQFRLEILTDEQ